MLTTRERLKGAGDALITTARGAGQPIFSMKSGSSASIIKALRSLAGIDPSPLSLRDATLAVRGQVLRSCFPRISEHGALPVCSGFS